MPPLLLSSPAQSSFQVGTAGPGAPSSLAEDQVSSSHLRTRPWSFPLRSRWTSHQALRPRPLSPSVSLPGPTCLRWSSKPIPSQPGGPSIYAWTYDPPRLLRRVYFLTLLFSFFFVFFKKQSKKIWMLETIKIQNCTSGHYITVTAWSLCVGLVLLTTSPSHHFFNNTSGLMAVVFWPSLSELD